ncbi:hypothetical protein [Clostridium cellulovorans]|uniref:Uncharacterized protein n=1 Tax=Clostridium cellulovorans (strain ATCC 35296 / DSM 3052 / OCM 3 / 743B) TaxID=573061 RepID=D9SV97_CLOC7|nr:hypothetical protein [Clostridium cellulovorans]ADL53071.1 hypothetical protein Clocel_3392 [Clostridium cellulovorans 743B]
MITVLITISVLIAMTGIFLFRYYYYYWIPRKRPFEIIGCILTGDDNIINISFKINRMGYIVKGTREIYIIDEATGIKFSLLSLPKFGEMITRKGKRGRYGYMMFVNVGNVIKHESKVTVNIGDYQKKHVNII